MLRQVPRRRSSACPLATGLLLLAIAFAGLGQARAAVDTPIVSGLAWRSGSSTSGSECLTALRGRALDVQNIFVAPPTFDRMVANTGSWVRRYAQRTPLLVVSLALLPTSNKGQFARCAAGDFNGYFTQIGANLKDAAPGVIVRLGWEANIGSKSHPWGVDGPAQVPDYVACWRRAAVALKVGSPRIRLEWTNAKRTSSKSLRVLDMYPGDDVVDLWGVHYYDTGPQKNTQETWDSHYDATHNGGPWGLGTWLEEARRRGKKLAVSEWGVWANGTNKIPDNPLYIANMHRFFETKSSDIAYETYFNNKVDKHQLCEGGIFPEAAAMYKMVWGGS